MTLNNFFIFGAKYLYAVTIEVALFYFLRQPKGTKKKNFGSIVIVVIVFFLAHWLLKRRGMV